MKYAIIIADGAADYPLDELGGETPLQVAKKPVLDALARSGRQGTVATTPEGYLAGSDVCSMCLLGYEPARYHPGRAPLEAAAMGIEVSETDWIFRCNLITVVEGIIEDHSAGHITTPEAKRLIEDFAIRAAELSDELTFHPGVSYRHIMVDRSGRDYSDLVTVPPHDVPGESMKKHLPKGGPNARLLQQLIAASAELFASHEVNTTRAELGEGLATHVWLWGAGQRPSIPTFEKLFGLKGAMITAVDLLAGIAALIGWDRLDVPGITGYHDTDYAAKGRYACDALDQYDLVCVHVEAPDEASHQGDVKTKIASIECIDRYVLGPIVEKLKRSEEGWRILVLPDHYTRVDTRKHDATPPPFCMAGTNVQGVVSQPFDEVHAAESGLHIEYGHELMEYFLRSGI